MLANEIHAINAGRFVPVFIDQTLTTALVDSGNSAGSCISASFAQKLGLTDNDIEPCEIMIGTAKKGSSLTCLGQTKENVSLTFAGTSFSFKFRPMIIKELASPVNLSIDFLEDNNIDQLHSSKCIRVKNKLIKMIPRHKVLGVQQLAEEDLTDLNTYVDETVVIPAMSARFVSLRIPKLEKSMWLGGSGILQADDSFAERFDILPTQNAVVTVNNFGKTKTAVLNNSGSDILVHKNVKFGTFESVIIQDANVKPKRLDWPRQKIIDLFKLNESDLLVNNKHYMDKAINLLREFGDMISEDPQHFGNTSLVQHTIDTGQSKPIRQKIRPLNPELEKDLDKQLLLWKEKDIIEESNSPWSSRLVPVKKKNGTTRWCVDYRELNKATVKDSFPLPNIEESLTRMANCNVFSALDGTGAYHAVHIDEQDREKTAFACHKGTFHFKRMPFGLCNAPATFSRLIMKALMGLDKKYYAPFLDDVAIFSKSFNHHMKHLWNVLNAQRQAGMTLNPAKCQLFRSKIDFLGHTVSGEGIETNKEFVEVIEQWPIPKNIKELRTFLGKTGYYRKFIKDYSKIACPLLNMITAEATKTKNKRITLTELQLMAFEQLKKALTSAPVLTFADFQSDEPFILDTDWSKDPGAIGAVLSQVQDGQERVICYGARKLTSAERDYSSNKGELLAVIHFIKLWKFFLWPKKFILRTDHAALKWIYSMDHPQSMLMRWLETLSHHNFDVVCRKGTQHGNADALSRITHVDLEGKVLQDQTDDFNNEIQQLEEEVLEGEEEDDVVQYERSLAADNTMKTVKSWLQGDFPEKETIKGKGRDLHAYWHLSKLLLLHDDRIFLRWKTLTGKTIKRLCIPENMQTTLIRRYHEQAHVGQDRLTASLQEKFYFNGMKQKVAEVVNNCTVCQQIGGQNKPQQHTHKETMSEEPWQKISVDLVGPMPKSSNGNTYLLTAKCCFTRWIEAIPIDNIQADTVARALFNHVLSRYGMPEVIHSDRGKQFECELMKSLCKLLGIKKTFTPAYNPKSNPVERAHRDMKAALRAMEHLPGDWEDHLPMVLLALRTSKCRSTGVSPYLAMFGRQAQVPLDVMYGNPGVAEEEDETSITKTVRENLETIYKYMREKQLKATERQRTQYKDKEETFQVGDKVWVFTPTIKKEKGSKFSIYWTGPWVVVEKVSDVVFIVKTVGNWNKKELALTVGIDRIKRYKTNTNNNQEEQLNLRANDLIPFDSFAENIPRQTEPTGSNNNDQSHSQQENKQATLSVEVPYDIPKMIEKQELLSKMIMLTMPPLTEQESFHAATTTAQTSTESSYHSHNIIENQNDWNNQAALDWEIFPSQRSGEENSYPEDDSSNINQHQHQQQEDGQQLNTTNSQTTSMTGQDESRVTEPPGNTEEQSVTEAREESQQTADSKHMEDEQQQHQNKRKRGRPRKQTDETEKVRSTSEGMTTTRKRKSEMSRHIMRTRSKSREKRRIEQETAEEEARIRWQNTLATLAMTSAKKMKWVDVETDNNEEDNETERRKEEEDETTKRRKQMWKFNDNVTNKTIKRRLTVKEAAQIARQREFDKNRMFQQQDEPRNQEDDIEKAKEADDITESYATQHQPAMEEDTELAKEEEDNINKENETKQQEVMEGNKNYVENKEEDERQHQQVTEEEIQTDAKGEDIQPLEQQLRGTKDTKIEEEDKRHEGEDKLHEDEQKEKEDTRNKREDTKQEYGNKKTDGSKQARKPSLKRRARSTQDRAEKLRRNIQEKVKEARDTEIGMRRSRSMEKMRPTLRRSTPVRGFDDQARLEREEDSMSTISDKSGARRNQSVFSDEEGTAMSENKKTALSEEDATMKTIKSDERNTGRENSGKDKEDEEDQSSAMLTARTSKSDESMEEWRSCMDNQGEPAEERRETARPQEEDSPFDWSNYQMSCTKEEADNIERKEQTKDTKKTNEEEQAKQKQSAPTPKPRTTMIRTSKPTTKPRRLTPTPPMPLSLQMRQAARRIVQWSEEDAREMEELERRARWGDLPKSPRK